MKAIVSSSDTFHQQALALRSACLHLSTLKLTKSAGLLPSHSDDETKSRLFLQMILTLKEVLSAGNGKRINADCSTYAKVVMSSMVGCGATICEITRAHEIDRMSVLRRVSKGKARVENARVTQANWLQKVTFAGFSKLTTEIECSLD